MPYCKDQFFRFYDGGAGASSQPTILLHGLGGTHLSWPPRFRRLPGQNIYAVDLPGHGKSMIPACVDMACHILFLHQFIQCMHFKPINLIGHSMGAMVALAFANTYPATIHTLSLFSIGAVYPFTHELEQSFRLEKTKSKGIEMLMAHGFHPGFSRQLRIKILEPLIGTRLSLLHADAQVGASFYAEFFTENIDFPTLLVSGGNDALVPQQGVRNLDRKINKSQLKIVENCGHFVLYEKQEIVLDTLIGFLKKHKAGQN